MSNEPNEAIQKILNDPRINYNARTDYGMAFQQFRDDHLRELLRGVNLSESTTDTSYASSISPESAARFLFQAGFGVTDADIAAF